MKSMSRYLTQCTHRPRPRRPDVLRGITMVFAVASLLLAASTAFGQGTGTAAGVSVALDTTTSNSSHPSTWKLTRDAGSFWIEPQLDLLRGAPHGFGLSVFREWVVSPATSVLAGPGATYVFGAESVAYSASFVFGFNHMLNGALALTADLQLSYFGGE